MRTLATQVKLRRLIRTSAQDWGRLASDPLERARAGSVADRLLELAAEVRGAWRRESQPGDTVWSIAVEHYPADDVRVRVDDIEQANGLAGPTIQVGQTLRLPG